MAERKPSTPPPGTATRARLALLDEVRRDRVRWVVPHGPALLTPRQKHGMVKLVDVTRVFAELARPKWADVGPWDDDHPPATVPCRITPKGEKVLMTTEYRAHRRKVAKQAKARRSTTRSSAKRGALASLVALGRSVWSGGRK